jgi:tyrosinase
VPFVRKEIRSLAGTWNDTVLWYARAVGMLKQRPLADPTSWGFLAAIHGFHPVVWTRFGFMDATTPEPSPDLQGLWAQCQHQSWYFLPWHRGYLFAFEEIVRSSVVAAGGPQDWALPYWNYSKEGDPAARVLPEAFAAEKLPDGEDNPLFVERRFGAGTLPITLPPTSVTLGALRATTFSGGSNDIPPGFGGPVTTFHHGPESRTSNGALEALPHNVIHGDVGGVVPGTDPDDWRNNGLMSMPITAGLDPIFWLHHANIDRLWAAWSRMDGHSAPEDADWLDGPADRGFAMPRSDGQIWQFTARAMLDTRAQPLDYSYDDETPPAVPPRVASRMAAFGGAVTPAGAGGLREAGMAAGEPELIGASDGEVRIAGRTRAEVQLDAASAQALRASLARTAAAGRGATVEPERVFLKLEGVRGTADAAVYNVYIDLPPNAPAADFQDRLAGTLSLFGISDASDRGGPTAGNGFDQVFEISEIVDALHLSGDDLARLDVQFVPSNPAGETSNVAVRRISVFKLGE